MKTDGFALCKPCFEVVAFQHAGDRQLSRNTYDCSEVKLTEPFAIEHDPSLARIQYLAILLLVGSGIDRHFLRGKHGARCRDAARVADARGEVADDHDDFVA